MDPPRCSSAKLLWPPDETLPLLIRLVQLALHLPLKLVLKLPPDYKIHPLHVVWDMSWISHYAFPADVWSLGLG